MIYVTGSAGGGGAGGPSATSFGTGGGAGAAAIRHPLVLWPGIPRLDVVVGVGGKGGATGAAGSTGGSSRVSVVMPANVKPIELLGGGGGIAIEGTNTGGLGGSVELYGQRPGVIKAPTIAPVEFDKIVNILKIALQSWPTTVFNGISAYRANFAGYVDQMVPTDMTYGAANPLSGNFGGNPANYENYGRGGARSDNRIAATGQDGSDGIMILEFVEGLYNG